MSSALDDAWEAQYEEIQQLWDLGRLSESAACLARALSEHGNLPAIRLAQALQLQHEEASLVDGRTDRLDEIRRLLAEAVDGEVDPHTLVAACSIACGIRDVPLCTELLRRISPNVDDLPEDELALVAYATALVAIDRGKLTVAEKQLRAARVVLPDIPELASTLADVMIAANRFEEAAELVAEALSTFPSDAKLLSQLRQLTGSSGVSSTGSLPVRFT